MFVPYRIINLDYKSVALSAALHNQDIINNKGLPKTKSQMQKLFSLERILLLHSTYGMNLRAYSGYPLIIFIMKQQFRERPSLKGINYEFDHK